MPQPNPDSRRDGWQTTLTIPHRFRGPAQSGNGGWVSGAIAELVNQQVGRPHEAAGSAQHSVTVRLRTPPPLQRALTVRADDDGQVRVQDGDTVVATALTSPPLAMPTLQPVPHEVALAAGRQYRGLQDHPFPSCFACGTGRDPAEALCLRTGPVPGRPGLFATAWTPAEVTVPITWAALDCPGAWAGDVAGRPMVLGTMTGQLNELPEVGQPHVVLSWTSGEAGRKVFSHCVLCTADGVALAQTEATWILVDPASITPH